MKTLVNLNPLRFFLALIVLVYHLRLFSVNQGLPFLDDFPILDKGIEAVYMFFVLSGFLIIRIIYKEKASGKFSKKNFYMRRVLRILPLYYLIVFVGFTFYHIVLPYLGIPFQINYNLTEGLLLSIFLLPNVLNYYDPGGILGVLWSIGIEEQFYLFIAPLLFFVKTHHIIKVLVIIFIGYFIIYHLEFFYFLNKYNFVYFYMIIGGVISIFEEEKKLNFLKEKKIVPVIVTILVVLHFFTNYFKIENEFLYNLYTSILFSLFVYSISHLNGNVEIKSKILNYFGKISYGIYMYHVIAINIVAFVFLKVIGVDYLNETITIILVHLFTIFLTLILAHFSYKYFEMFFLKLKEKYR